MRSKLFSFTFAIVLGLATPVVSAIVFPDVVMAQTVEEKKKEADRLLQQGIQQYQTSQFTAALQSWKQTLLLYREIGNRKGEGNALGNLGLAYYSLGNYPKAIDYHEQRLAIAREIKDRLGEGQSLGNLGLAYDSLGNYPKAIDYHEQSLVIAREIKDRLGEGQSLGNLGIAYDSLGNYPKAIEYQEQSLAIAREIKNRLGEGNALGSLGNAYQALGNYPKAIDYHEQYLAIAREIKNRLGEGAALGNLGIAYSSLGNYPKAIEYYEQYLAIAREIKNRLGEGAALGNLGNAYQALGNYPKAIDYHEKSLAIAREIKDRLGEGQSLGNLGNVYYSLGNYPKAIEYHEQRLAIAREIKDRLGEGLSLGNLGNVYYSLGNYPKAIEYHEQRLAIAREIKNRLGEGQSLGNLGLAYQSLGNYPKAIDYHEQYLAIAREIKDRLGEGQSLGNLGNVYYSLGNYPKAIEYHEQRLAIAREIKDRNGEYAALNNLGVALAKQDPELAIVFYKQSVTVSETIRESNRPLSRDLQSSYTQTVAKTYRNLADLLLSQGRVLEAQQVLELLKNQELRDYTRETRSANAPPTPLLNPVETPVIPAHNKTIALGTELTQCEREKCARKSQLIAQVTEANDAYEKIVKRLKDLLSNQQVKDPAQLQNAEFTIAAQNVILANPKVKTVLIYPLVLDDKLWLVWGSQAGKTGVVFESKAIPVKRQELSTKVEKLQTLLKTNGNLKELQQTSQELYQWLIAPIRKQLDDNQVQHLVFSLDRATRYIPMNALHDGKQYLVENFATSTILTAATNTTDRLSPDRQENSILGLGLSNAIAPFSALPGVETELNSIIQTTPTSTALYPGLKLFNTQFTEAALRENIADHRILHIATHGSFTTNDPENSFLLLGNGQKLNIPIIRTMKALAGTHLVILSACETGKGGIDKEGLEVAGMGHYFMLGGAKSVMASLWLVNDPATALLMQNFYTSLSQPNTSKAEALRQVQIRFIKRQLTDKDAKALDRGASDSPNRGVRLYRPGQPPPDSFEHPYYWAPFILIGNNL
jgi:CHAT domain-containing protein/peptide methionine sulfoxide reductase MsrA